MRPLYVVEVVRDGSWTCYGVRHDVVAAHALLARARQGLERDWMARVVVFP